MSDKFLPCTNCGLPVGCDPGDTEASHQNKTYCRLLKAEKSVADLQAALSEVTARADLFHSDRITQRQRAERAEAEIKDSVRLLTTLDLRMIKERQALAAAQSTIANLNGQVERMREAIEKQPHSENCNTRYACARCSHPSYSGYHDMGHPAKAGHRFVPGDCNCWKRAAIGGVA